MTIEKNDYVDYRLFKHCLVVSVGRDHYEIVTSNGTTISAPKDECKKVG